MVDTEHGFLVPEMIEDKRNRTSSIKLFTFFGGFFFFFRGGKKNYKNAKNVKSLILLVKSS